MEGVIIQREEEKKTSTICRVCLNYDSLQSGKGFSLFEKYNNIFIFEKINYIANITIKRDDDLPDRICSTCVLALENACNFKQKCENSDVILHSTLQRSEPLQEQFIDVAIKEEKEDEYEYDYLDEDKLSLLEFQRSDEYNPTCTTQSSNTTFKSKAIDLHLECDDCGDFFKSKCKMRVHWKKEHQPKQLTCPICKKILKSFKAFHSHMKRKSKSCMNASKMRVEGEGRSRVFYCKECNAHSTRIQTVMAHLVTHTGERPYKCNICGKTFTQHSSLIGHKEGAHKTYAKEGTCHHCGKHFKGRNKFYRHMKTHSNKQFPCKVCSKTLKSKIILRQHMKRHSGVKSFTCEVCAKTFYTSSDLCNHKANLHDKKKIYSCDLCEYKTPNCSCMSRHRRRHTDHNVACDSCGMFVDNLLQLEMHKKRHFEKNFQCAHCNKMYYSRKSLSAHVRKVHKIYAAGSGVTIEELAGVTKVLNRSIAAEVKENPQSI